MVGCVAYGCTNRSSGPQKISGIAFHSFPKDEEQKQLWIKAIKRKNWAPSPSSKLCSAHFPEEMIDRTSIACIRLRDNAIPTVFEGFPSYLQKKYKPRKPQTSQRSMTFVPSENVEVGVSSTSGYSELDGSNMNQQHSRGDVSRMETGEKKVLCVGLCCLDIVMMCESYPLEDSDQRCLSHRWQRGGNASNNATIFSEFGISCEILGTMSSDIGGQFMKKDFEQHNILFENCRDYDEYQSPTSVVWINSQNGSRTIVHSHTNMPEVKLDDFKCLNLQIYCWIHFEIRPYFQEIKKMIQHVRDWNCMEANTPIKISIEIEKPRVELMEFINLPDIVFVSKDFAVACGQSDMKSAVEYFSLNLRNNGVIICAWGDKGASAKSRDGPVVFSEAHKPPRVTNTLGAGDTFVAATIMSLMKGHVLADSIKIGCKVAGTKCGLNDTSGLASLCPFF